MLLERENYPLPRPTWGVELEGSTAAVCWFIKEEQKGCWREEYVLGEHT